MNAESSTGGDGNTSHHGGGNPNHDPKTGRFTSGPQATDPDEIVINGRKTNGATSGPHWKVKDGSVVVPDLVRNQVDDVAKDYNAATGKDLTITDGPRTPRDQAERMAYKFAHGDYSTYPGYFGRQIANAYREGIAEGKPHEAIIGDMAELISRFLKEAHPISAHLVNRAVDFSSRGMSQSDKDALIDAIKRHGGVSKPEGVPPHTHATFGRR